MAKEKSIKSPILPFLDIPLFQCRVHLHWGADMEVLQKAYIEFFDIDKPVTFFEDEIDGKSGIVFMVEGNGHFLIWLRKKPKGDIHNYKWLIHECVHVAYHILLLTDMAYDDELMAYLVEWLVDEIGDLLSHTKEI